MVNILASVCNLNFVKLYKLYSIEYVIKRNTNCGIVGGISEFALELRKNNINFY